MRRNSWNKAVHVSTWQIAAKYLLAQLVLWGIQTQAAANWSQVVFTVVLSLAFNYMCRWMTGRGRLGLLFSASLAMIYVVSVQKQWRSASLVERKSFQLSSRGDCAPSRQNRNTLPGQLSVPLMGLRWSMDRAEFKETLAAPWWTAGRTPVCSKGWSLSSWFLLAL